MILCVSLNPVLDSTMFIDEFRPVYRTNARKLIYETGGKGNNVARALGILGVPARAFAALGGGVGRLAADSLRREMAESGAAEPAIAWVTGETRLQVTIVDGQGEQRSYFAPAAPFSAADAEVVRSAASAALAAASAVCLCGSSPGPLADELFADIVRLAAGRGLPALLDSYGGGLSRGLAARPTIVKMNRAEAEGLTGRTLSTEADCCEALTELRAAGAQVAMITLGAEGALLAAADQVWRARPPRVAALNPIGSGDAASAGFMAAFSRGEDPVACFRLAMAAAAANTLTWAACQFEAGDVERLAPEVEIERLL